MPNTQLKVGDRVSGKNLNGKPISGEIVQIPGGLIANPDQVAHVKTDDKAQIIHFAKLSDLSAAGSTESRPTGKPAAAATA